MTILYKGGRLASWHELSGQEQDAASQEHVDLMLDIAQRHGLERIEGFRLLGPQEDWERFWIMTFPTLEGAKAWIEAETAPSYGLYGYYEYHLAESMSQAQMIAYSPVQSSRADKADPHVIPALDADRASLVVIIFERLLPGVEPVDESEHFDYLKTLKRDHPPIRHEGFTLYAPLSAWHTVRLAEFTQLEDAEVWIEAETRPERRRTHQQTIHLARKWAPSYFARWVNPIDSTVSTG